MKKVFLIVLLAVQLVAFSQTNYTALNGPFGGGLEDLETWNSRLVGLNGQGVIISDDGGATWRTSNTGISDPFNARDLDKDPVSGKLFMATFSRLYSSTDGGSNWIVVAQTGFSDTRKLEIAPNGSLFIATFGGKVYRSTNGGVTWPTGDVATLPNNPYVTTFHISAAGFLFVGTSGHSIYRSNNANSVLGFTQLTSGLSDAYISSFTSSGTNLYVTTNGGIFRSTNNGSTWTSIRAAGAAPAGMDDNGFYYARVNALGSTLMLMNSRYNPVSGFEEGLLWRSTDQGTTWTPLTHPMILHGGRLSFPRDLFFSDVTTFYASFQKGLFKTNDGGNSWFEINNGIAGLTGFQPDKLVLTDNGRLLLAPEIDYGIFLSTDDGQSWDYLNSGALNTDINGFKKIGPSIFAFGNGLLKSTDNGGTWTQVYSQPFLGCGAYFNYLENTSASNFYSIATYNCNTGTTEYNLLKSSDAGVSWTTHLITGIPQTNFGFGASGIKVDASGNVYMSTYNFSLQRQQLLKIDASTYQATDITPAGYTVTDAFTIVNNKILITSNGIGQGPRMLISADAGLTWSVKAIPMAFGRIKAISESTLYIMGSNSTVYISTDGGESWVDTGNFGSGRQAYDVVISSTNFSYVAVNYGPVFKSNNQVIPPAAPTGLTVAGFSTFGATLKWDDNSNNETNFVIERSEGNNTSYDSIGFQSASTLTFRVVHTFGLRENTLYYYRVRAVGAAGNSAYSNEVSFTTISNCQVYTIPLNRSWTATTQTLAGSSNPVSITGGFGSYIISNLLNANAVAGITPAINPTLQVQISEVCGSVYLFPSTVYANGNGTWDAVTNTLTIKWQTRPNNTPYRSETTVFTLNPTDPPPGPPGNVGAYIKSNNEVVINWSAGQFAQTYQVQRSTTPGSGFVDIGSPITAAPFLFIDNSTLTPGTTYYYRIRATSFGNPTPTNSAEVSLAYQTPRFNAISLVGFDFPTQGISWADIDNDGDDDLLVTPFNAFENGFITVFENDGAGNLSKINVPGLSDYNISTARVISVGDINNDGYSDFIVNGSEKGGEMFINNRDKSFTRTTIVAPRASGLDWYASLADFNNDGKLDAVFSEDVVSTVPPTTRFRYFTQNADTLFDAYELGEIAAESTVSRAGSWADYDKDGDLDFLRGRFNPTATDFDQLYRNNGDGTFTPVTGTAFEADFIIGSRSMSWGDYDNDLDFDVYVVQNNTGNSMLYRNNGDGTFTKMTASLLSETKTVQSFGSAWGDVDNDGDLDMTVASALQGVLYLNDGVGNFSKYTAQEYLVASDATRTNIAFAFSDYDNNGTLDIATGKNIANFPTILLKNTLVPGTNTRWLKVKLQGNASNRAGIGARIEITTPNAKKQMRAIESLSGYGSASSLTAHFGLANQNSATVDIFWPSGLRQTITNVTANQTLVVPEDGTGPTALVLLPANANGNVSSSTKLEITLNEASSAITGKKIILSKASDPANPVFSTDVINGVKTGDKYSFTIPAKLEQGVAYRVRVEAGAFRDIYGNLSLLLPESSWSFTVGQGPQLAAINPSNNAVAVNTTTKLAITFNGPVTGVAGKFLRVFSQADLTRAVTTITANLAEVSGNTASFTLADKLQLDTRYTVSVDAGAFIDTLQNESAPIIVGTGWSFTTTRGPQVTAFLPINGAQKVLTTQSLSLTFNSTVSGVAGKQIRVANGATNVLTVDASAIGVLGNVITILPPSGNWPFLTPLTVSIDPGAFIDAAGNDFAGLSGTAWSFTTVEAPDVTAPAIVYNSATISVLEKGFAPQNISVSATDAKGVVKVIMHHRKLTEATINKIELSVPPSNGNDWVFTVTNSMTDDMGFEYYFEAFDLAGNKVRSPSAANSFYKSSIKFAASNAPKLTLATTGRPEDWRIIAVPYQLENGNFQIKDVLSAFGVASADSWRLIRYDKSNNTERWLEFPNFSDFERGRGYFINSISPKEAVFTNAIAPNFDQNNLAKLALKAGWNQIGNPYTVAINWEEVRTFNSASANVGGLKIFVNGQYTNGTTLQAGQGGFVFAESATTIDVPFTGQTKPGARIEQVEFGNDLAATSWVLPLSLAHNYISNDIAGIGMHAEASLGKDRFDDIHAPRFLGYSEIGFELAERVQGKFARHIVPTEESFMWSFVVNSNLPGDAVITWDNAWFGDNDKQLVLVDEANVTVVDMRSVNQYAFTPSEASIFKIYFGKNAMEDIATEAFNVSSAFPNPTNGETTIRFSLPKNGGDQQRVAIKARDALGKPLGILTEATFASGFHEMVINTSHLQGVDGLLLLTLDVSNALGRSQKQIKVVVKK